MSQQHIGTIDGPELAGAVPSLTVSQYIRGLARERPDLVALVDAASGHTYTYTLVSGTGSTDNGSFTISGNQLLTNDIFDYDTKSSYSIRVQVTDENGNTFYQVFTITIIDNTAITRNGTTLTVTGTTGNDTFGFNGGTTDTFSLNGVNYAAKSSTISKIVFDGNGGIDSSYATGTGGLTLVAWTDQEELTGSGFVLDVQNIMYNYVYGSAGDTAYFYDGAGRNYFVGTASYSYMQNENFLNEAYGFSAVYGSAGSGSYDVAFWLDGAGSNTFVGTSTYSYMQGENFFYQVNGFYIVNAYAGSGSYDVAYLLDGAGSNTFVGTSTYSYLQGSNFLTQATGFNVVAAVASSGSSDVAYLFDTPGDDLFYGTQTTAHLSGSNVSYDAYGFGQVEILSDQGGYDQAFYTALDYQLFVDGDWH